jgi:hypothetical protein
MSAVLPASSLSTRAHDRRSATKVLRWHPPPWTWCTMGRGSATASPGGCRARRAHAWRSRGAHDHLAVPTGAWIDEGCAAHSDLECRPLYAAHHKRLVIVLTDSRVLQGIRVSKYEHSTRPTSRSMTTGRFGGFVSVSVLTTEDQVLPPDCVQVWWNEIVVRPAAGGGATPQRLAGSLRASRSASLDVPLHSRS